MKLSEEMAEVLEAAWVLEEKGEASLESLSAAAGQPLSPVMLQAMQDSGLIATDPANRISFLPAGRDLAGRIIRAHRLAERLMCDVLGMNVEDAELPACEFEHMVEQGVANSICTLLGHPRSCPHNKPIPEGECCRQARDELHPIVVSCTQLGLGKSGKIAYVCLREHSLLARLSALGIAPGAPLKLLQKWPAYVLQCDETEIALEENIACNIYVWKESEQ